MPVCGRSIALERTPRLCAYLGTMFIRFTLTLICTTTALAVLAQTPPPKPEPPTISWSEVTDEEVPPPVEPQQDAQQPQVYTVVEQMPEFPGGTSKLMEYMQKNIVYPQDAVEGGIEGRVFVRFVLDPEGFVKDVTVMRGAAPALDKEALRVVKSMPKWLPGMQNGKKVSTYYNLPVVFKLTQ